MKFILNVRTSIMVHEHCDKLDCTLCSIEEQLVVQWSDVNWVSQSLLLHRQNFENCVYQ